MINWKEALEIFWGEGIMYLYTETGYTGLHVCQSSSNYKLKMYILYKVYPNKGHLYILYNVYPNECH